MLASITRDIAARSREILGENLVGVYLHGSAVMGCFQEKKSDIDLLVVVHGAIPEETKRRYMDMVVALNEHAPEKGIEISVVREDVCRPFVYPTPFELHFSKMHLEWYRKNPSDYVEKMHGVDRDLAAHFTVLWHRGKCLWGKAIRDVFEEVPGAFYFDSIWSDIENAREDILTDSTYIVLNLCRVLAYRKDGLILSKQEGGDWAMERIPGKYRGLISRALEEYASGEPANGSSACETLYLDYAAYMLYQIREPVEQ